jgi:2,3-bisphosphoglycerate-dependent phosphoglycerate mutase
MPVLVLLRHGQSVRNEQSRFTGWTNVDFAPHGEEEARQAGRLLLKAGYGFDICFTSVLKRAIRTLHFVFGQMDLLWLPEHKTWRLNEQYSGALQGLNKAETAESYEEEQVAAAGEAGIFRLRPSTLPTAARRTAIRATPSSGRS